VNDEPAKPKLLLLELWGIGDLTFATAFLRLAVTRYDVVLVGKAHAAPLLAPTFPQVRFVAYDAPWTAFRGKYHLWKWKWGALWRLIRQLRRERFAVAVSVRHDPRDHLLMRLTGARARYGFPAKGSGLLLHHRLRREREKQHRVEDWRQLAAALNLEGSAQSTPMLAREAYASERVKTLLASVAKPLVVLHPGARIAVRRWPEPYFESVVRRLRETFDFHLALVPDPDGYGAGLAPLSDQVLPALAMGELVDLLGRTDLLLCNDSGPGHVAASCGRPAIVMFGPTDPDWFRPFGEMHRVVIRDICAWRPCFDYCKFPEPYCMTKLLPDDAWPEIRDHIRALIASGVLPARLEKGTGA
jgi:ADP-heptose:LPS heptosyltransferase